MIAQFAVAGAIAQRLGAPDEDAFGVSYEQIDDFLEGKPVAAAAREIILAVHRRSAHKRALPVEPPHPA